MMLKSEPLSLSAELMAPDGNIYFRDGELYDHNKLVQVKALLIGVLTNA